MNQSNQTLPWYQRTLRWGQTNLTEMDPIHCDVNGWRSYWHQTRIQGIIVNAGGIVAYYPSAHKLHYRAKGLNERDLFGEFAAAAREEGLTLLARMDSNRAAADFYQGHPDWFAVNAQGVPYRSDERYIACVNSPYYKEFIPEILKEIIERYQPDGFTDNSWTGLSRHDICYCEHCKRGFKGQFGEDLPSSADWQSSVYRKWLKWNYACRTENWDLFNDFTRQYGGPDCLWLGMVNGNPVGSSFCDLREIGARSQIVMCDHQSRDERNGFEQNSINGNLLQGIAGWDKIVPESMANYVRGSRVFRQACNPMRETRLWMLEGIAGGISPWYHHIGAMQEDKRQFFNAPPIMQWHEKNEEWLYNRIPAANIGLVWSRENIDLYGQDDPEEQAALPWRGFVRAMIRSRIPFVPVHADHMVRDANNLDVLILPDLAVMSDAQCEAVNRFVLAGGSLILTGASGTLDSEGQQRQVYPLAEAVGIQPAHEWLGAAGPLPSTWEVPDTHNYMRLPKVRHSMLDGFEDTDILAFGGRLQRVEGTSFLKTVATYIPDYPIYPPEFSWMRQEKTDIPVILAGEHPAGGRIVYLAGDIDRCYGRANLPDHGDLLANAVRYVAADMIPLKIEGPGYLDCKLYKQQDKTILHIVNLSGCNCNPGYVEDYYPVGPIKVSIRCKEFIPRTAALSVAGRDLQTETDASWTTIHLDSIEDHELIVFS